MMITQLQKHPNRGIRPGKSGYIISGYDHVERYDDDHPAGHDHTHSPSKYKIFGAGGQRLPPQASCYDSRRAGSVERHATLHVYEFK